MANILEFILNAKDNASGVFDKVGAAGKKAAGDINGAFSGIQGAFSGMTGLIGGLAAIAGGMAFKSIVDSTVSWNIETGKLAQTLGMTAEQASVYKVAMQTMGVDQDLAEKAGLRLAKTLGTNEEAIRNLGVATRDSSGHLRSTAEIMPEVNQRLSEMKAGTDRNVAAMEIYGKSWGEIKGLLKINSEAMNEARETAQRLHLIVGEEGIEQSKQYKKQLNELGLVAKSMEIQFGNQLLPALLKLGEWFGKAGPELASIFGYALKGIVKSFETVGSTIAFVAAEAVTGFEVINRASRLDFKGAWGQMKAMKDIAVQYGNDIKKTWTQWDDPKKTQKKVTGEQYDLEDSAAEKAKKEEEKRLKELQQKYKEHAQKIIETEKDRWQKLEEGEKKYAALVKTALETKIKEIDDLKKRLADITNTLDEIDKKRAEKLTPGIDPNLDAYEKYQAQIALLQKQEAAAGNIQDLEKRTKALTQIYDAWSQITDEVKVGNDTIITQQEILERSKTEMDRLREKITKPFEDQKSAAEKVRDELAKMYDNAITKADEYKQHVDQLAIMLDNLKDKEVIINFKATGIEQLQQMAALMSGTGTVTSGKYSSLTDWWSSVHTGSGWQTVSEFAGASSFDGFLASGGPVKPFGTYIVGEHGPEVLKLGGQGGTVVPNNQLGGNVTITGGVNITLPNVTNQSTARDLARQLYPELQRLSKNTRSA